MEQNLNDITDTL